MASKVWLLAKAFIILSLLVLVGNIFWFFKLHRQSSEAIVLPVNHDSNLRPIAIAGAAEKEKIENVNKNLNLDVDVTIAAVACGDRVNETLVMMKSALIFHSKFVSFIVFADELSLGLIDKYVHMWPANVLSRMKLDLRPIKFPKDKAEEWKKLFKPCASQRLFLPSLLGEVDSLLYVDTDTLFLAPPQYVWGHFKKMDHLQMAAVTPEHEDSATGWYNRFAKHPYYGNLGINSGVMLMNLTRMRQFGWEKYVVPVYQEYKSKIIWGDQDIINIVFHFHPEKLYVYPCHFNYRPDHCMYMSVCKSAEENGVYVLHGNRASFHNEKQPAFRVIHEAIDQYEFGSDINTNLLVPMKNMLQSTENTNCGKIHSIFTRVIENDIVAQHHA